MKRSEKRKRKPFESARPGYEGGDPCVRLYESMILSAAWLDLTGNQRDLYVICKMQYGRRQPAEEYPGYKLFDRNEVFFLSWEMARELAACGEGTFYKDMKALRKHGFVSVLLPGGNRRGGRETVYELSSDWQRWKPKQQVKSAVLVSGAFLE